MLGAATQVRVGRRHVAALVLSLWAASPAQAEYRASNADIELGSGTLSHLELAVGPTHLAVGLWDKLMVGTYTVPWLATLFFKGSVVPNVYVKLRLAEADTFALAVQSELLYAKLENLDDQGLAVRAWVWPTRLYLTTKWLDHFATTFEISAVLADLSADTLVDGDTEIHGVAIGNNVHVGVVQLYQWTRMWGFWARVRLLLNQSPVLGEGDARLDDRARLHVRARANVAEQSSGIALMSGIVWSWRNLGVRAGFGYGTWYLPWLGMPVGKDSFSGELSAFWRL